jgi:hypothetical protein
MFYRSLTSDGNHYVIRARDRVFYMRGTQLFLYRKIDISAVTRSGNVYKMQCI